MCIVALFFASSFVFFKWLSKKKATPNKVLTKYDYLKFLLIRIFTVTFVSIDLVIFTFFKNREVGALEARLLCTEKR